MERLREAKLARSGASTSPLTAAAPPEPMISGTPGESSEIPSQSPQGTAGEHEPEVLTESETLDKSLRLPVTAQLSEDESSESDEESEGFSKDDARQVYQEWVKGQPKNNIQMMAVMFMDALMDRFNMTAKEVGSFLATVKGRFVPGVRISTPTRVTSPNRGKENMPVSSF